MACKAYGALAGAQALVPRWGPFFYEDCSINRLFEYKIYRNN